MNITYSQGLDWLDPSGHAERVGLFQLYPLMVHVNPFGGSYAASVERSLAHYA